MLYSRCAHRCGSRCYADDLFLNVQSRRGGWREGGSLGGGWKVCWAKNMMDSFQLPLAFSRLHLQSITAGEWFIGTAGILAFVRCHPSCRRRRRLPVHPSHLLILSINASRQAGRHRVISPQLPPSSALVHPSIPLHHSQLTGAAWAPLICSLWICMRLLSVGEL